ncbi:alpha beta hydrolase domain-containing 17C [Brachionus plicatilis]|uniref:palmitoyl-protein hydrolase n=1 Tax=Brachionus plicatilis TaxID=10195 RepID=A0A3M7SGJ8_BRAPC|nr:alpha beta hydrolase domain-containing 17C [Brachionus plicatilis]
MNGLSAGELCCLFCCPPFPSQIVAKLAFLPPPPTYNLIINHDATLSHGEQASLNQAQPISNQAANPANLNLSGRNNRTASGLSNFMDLIRNSGRRLCSSLVCAKHNYAHQTGQVVAPPLTNAKIVMKEKAEWQYGPGELEKLEVFLTRTERGHQIACLFVRCSPSPKYTILFSHGNAVDIGQMSSFYFGLGSRLECNIFTYDYSGYGASSGTPNEKNLYADIRAAWNALRSRYGVSPSNIILYGQSIGTVPTVDLASKYDCAGVILHAPLMSGMRVAFNTKRTWCCDAFPSIDKVNKISSLVLVIHGTEDEVIDLSHGMAIHEKCPKAVDPLWVEGAGHNDIEIYAAYVERLKRFICEEIRMHQYSLMSAANAQQVATSLAQNIQTNQPVQND